jgi:hypothetical protein
MPRKASYKSRLNPKHYTRWVIQPLQFIMVNNLPFVVGNIIKYVMRFDAKDGLADLYKARTYLNRLIAQTEKRRDYWNA